MQKKNIKRVVLDIPRELALEIKVVATKKDTSIKRWLIKAILIQLYKDKS